MNRFGERLRELRKEKSLLQSQVAKIINVSAPTLSQYENGNRTPDPDTIITLADFFMVSTDYLLGRSDIRNPYTPKVLAAHSSSNQLSKEDLEDIDRILSIVRSQKNK